MNLIKNLYDTLIQEKNNYYNGNQHINDDTFDAMENKLKEIDPNNSYFDLVGTNKTSGDKIKHSVPMLSMKKVKTADAAKQWMVSSLMKYANASPDIINSTIFTVQSKIDGVSCSIKYDEQGRFLCMATRGNGEEGTIINYGEKILKANDLPRLLYKSGTSDYDLLNGYEIELRGEFYIHRTSANKDKPLRNIVAGLLSRKDLTPELDSIRICLYSIVNNSNNNFISYGEYFPEAIDKSKTIMNYSTKATINEIEKVYDDYNNSVRDNLPFETDGLVIYYPHTEHYNKIDSEFKEKAYHHYVLALKPPSKAAITKVTGINYAISKHGALIPTVNVEPIELSGREINKFTMTNWDNLLNKRIKLNSVISVKFANDIIPCLDEYMEYISENEIPFPEPTHCPICNSPVSKLGKNFFCTNEHCKGVLCARIVFLNKNANLKGLADSLTLRILNEFNLIDIASFYQILIDDNPSAKSLIGEKTYSNIKNEIYAKFSKLSEQELIAYGANIPGLGLKEVQKEKFINIYDYFEKININPNSAVKRNIAEWMKNKFLYNEFINLCNFINSLK